MATDWVHIDTAWQIVREECAKIEKDRDEWRELAERAIAQIEQWKAMCEQWEKHYYALKAQQNYYALKAQQK